MKCKNCSKSKRKIEHLDKRINSLVFELVSRERNNTYLWEEKAKAEQTCQILFEVIGIDKLIDLISELKDLRKKKECEQKSE